MQECQGIRTDSKEWYDIVVKDQPKGKYCGFCHKLNDMFDDIGFYHLSPIKGVSSIPTCWDCYKDLPGQLHRERYGVGER